MTNGLNKLTIGGNYSIAGPVYGSFGSGDASGSGNIFCFNTPYGLVINPLTNDVYVCNRGNGSIKKVIQNFLQPPAPSLSTRTFSTGTTTISFAQPNQASIYNFGASTITNYQYAISNDSGATYPNGFIALSPAQTSLTSITITSSYLTSGAYVKVKAVNSIGPSYESNPIIM